MILCIQIEVIPGFLVATACCNDLRTEGRFPQRAHQWRSVRAFLSQLIKIIKIDLLDHLYEMLRNPCGAGVKPTSCTCADGTSIGGGWVSCPSRWSQRNIVQQCTDELGQFLRAPVLLENRCISSWPTGKGAPKATDWRAPVGIAVLPLLAHVLMDPSRL